MNNSVAWMARNHVAANLLMLVFVVGGIFFGFKVKQEVFPEIALDMIQVSVPFPGASPEEVEEGVILLVEEALTGIDGIKQIKSVAGEGFGRVNAELILGEDPDLLLQDIKSEVDRITSFPEDAERPVVSKLVNRREVITVVLSGEVSERTLRELAEQVRDELLDNPEITQIDLGGVRPYEISIEVSEENLRRYGLTIEKIAAAVRQASIDLPGGTIETRGGEVLVRTKEKRYHGEEYRNIIVLARPDGGVVRLGDIATINDGFEATDSYAIFDGKPAAMLKIFRVGDQTPTSISSLVMDYVDARQATLPDSIHITTWNDRSEMLKSRRDLLVKNAVVGLVLVIITLGLFLEVRLALWVMLGIPISFLGTLLLMPAADVSINMISLFAFIMALGIVVDDAIVVGENIYAHRQKGKPYLNAAIDGALEVSQPVIFAILTSVAAFLPLVFVSGTMGKFIKVIPIVVILILIVSLFESLYVLPSHLALGKKKELKPGLLASIERVRLKFGHALDRFIAGPFRRTLSTAVTNRYLTLAIGIAIFILAISVVKGGIVKFRFMPEVDGDVINVSLQMPVGTPVEVTEAAALRIEEVGYQIAKEIDAGRPGQPSVLRHIYALVGGSMAAEGPQGGSGSSARNVASLAMLLTESEQRGMLSTDISDRWRAAVGEIPGADTLTFASNLIHLGANIDVRLAHQDPAVLQQATEQLKELLAQYPGVQDIEDNLASGKRELVAHLTEEGRSLGITEESLGRQIRSVFYGTEALSLQRGRNEVTVMVRSPESDRATLANLEQMRIRTPSGGEIPLARAAVLEEGEGFSSINRTDRKRVVNVTARVDSKVANAEEIIGVLQSGPLVELRNNYPGLSFDLEGENKERKESLGSMASGFGMALFAIYALLAIPFRSYSQPLLIMAAIPFGIVGAILGHLVMGYDLSMLSIFGIVALSGVVVNDSLLIIDFINRHRMDGKEEVEAVIESGQRRFRPILLTSLTTFFGLAPMILETSVQARFLIPMAISLGFGILFATVITLILIPSLYLVLEDLRALVGMPPLHGGAALGSPTDDTKQVHIS